MSHGQSRREYVKECFGWRRDREREETKTVRQPEAYGSGFGKHERIDEEEAESTRAMTPGPYYY